MFSHFKKLYSYSKSNLDILAETRTLITREDWARNDLCKKTIEQNLYILGGRQLEDRKDSCESEQKIFERTEELFKRLQALIQERPNGVSYKKTALQFYKLPKTNKTILDIWDLSDKYAIEAKWKETMASTKVAELGEDRQQLARDLERRWSKMGCSLPLKEISIYIAKDIQNTIQGVALAHIIEKNSRKVTHLYSLATKPSNTHVLGNERDMVPGVGSGLVNLVVDEVRSNPELEQKVRLKSSASAKEFYRRIGFKEVDMGDFELDFGRLKI